MLELQGSRGQAGPFKQIDRIEGGWSCDGKTIHDTVIGPGAVVEPYVKPQETIDAERAELLQVFIDAVIAHKIALQQGGVIYNGIPLGTTGDELSRINGSKLRRRGLRKIVLNQGRGATMQPNSSEMDGLFNAVEEYQQDVEDFAYDLIEAAKLPESDLTIDIYAGWPTNVLP